MYNPDDIETAFRELAETDRGKVEADELASELEMVNEMVRSDHMVERDFSMPELSLQRKTDAFGKLPDLIEWEDKLYFKIKSTSFIDEDDEPAEHAKFMVITDEYIYELYNKAQLIYDPKEPLKYKLQNYLDWDVNAPQELPPKSSLIYTFTSSPMTLTKSIYKSGDVFYIKKDASEDAESYRLTCAPDSDIFSIDFAVHCAISERKELDAIKKAKRELDKLIQDMKKEHSTVPIKK